MNQADIKRFDGLQFGSIHGDQRNEHKESQDKAFGNGGQPDGSNGSIKEQVSASVQKWLLVLIACSIAGVVLLSIYGKWQAGRIYDSASYANKSSVPGIVALDDARWHVTRMRLLLYRHAVNQVVAGKAHLEEKIRQEQTLAYEALRQYEAMPAEVQDTLMLAEDRRLLDGYVDHIAKVIALSRADDIGNAQAELSSLNEVGDKLSTVLDKHVRYNVEQGMAGERSAMRTFRQVTRDAIIFVLMIVGILLSIGYVIARRITIQVERIRLLARDNGMFRTMVECVKDQPVTVHDIDNGYCVVYANATACRHFGVDLETLLTWTPSNFDPHASSERLKQFSKNWGDGSNFSFESEHRIATGELIPVEVNASGFEHEGRRFNICLTRDLRPQREAEARMLEFERFETEQESALKLARFARSTPGFMFTIELRNGQMAMTYASPAIEEIFGIGIDEALADFDNLRALVIPEDLEKLRQLAALAQHDLAVQHIEYRIKHPRKGERWVESHFVPERRGDGTLEWHGFLTDITDRKRMEAVLAMREQEFRTLNENSPDMIIRYDLNCCRTYVNQAFLNATDAPLEDILGKPVSAVGWWSLNVSAQEFEQQLRQVIQTGEAATIQLYGHVPATGQPRYTLVRVVPEYDESEQIVSLMAVVRDVTELAQVEQALRQREQYQRALLDNFPFLVWLKDKDSRLLAANQQYARVANAASPRELEGKTDFDVFPHDLAQGYVEDDCNVLQSGEPKNVVEQYCDERGQLRWMETYKSVVMVDGKATGTVGFSRDITEQMSLQMDLANRERELRALIVNTPDVIIRYDLDCRRTYISPNYEEVYGNPVSAALGKKPTEAWGRPRMSPEAYENMLREVVRSGEPRDIELDWVTADGEYVCQSLRAVPEYDANGEICSVLSFTRDVSELKRVGQRANASELEYRTLIEQSPEIILRYNRDCYRVFANPAYTKATGFILSVALHSDLADSWRPENIGSDEYKALLRQVMETGEPASVIVEWTGQDGIFVCYDMRIVPEHDVDKTPNGALAIGHNISRLRQAEQVLIQREQEFRALVEHSPDTITRYDRECRRTYANPKMRADAGVELAELLYKTPEEFPGGVQASAYQDKIRQVLDTGEFGEFELAWLTGDGSKVCSHIRLVPEFDTNGHVTSVLAVGRDITVIDAYRKQIHSLAFFDSLTDLPNRALLSDRIRQTVADASWHGHQFGLMVLDLDRFKEVNDTLGHGVGDLLLREAAQRLLACVRIYDTVARLGGDEFAILLPEIRDGSALGTVAGKIIKAFNQPFMIDGRELFISTSIGIALYPDDSAEIDALFRYADSAMYHAKKQKGDNYQFYSADLTARLAGRMFIESSLRKALSKNELELYYQPQVALDSGDIIGAEALLRWNRSGHGMVPPDQFIPVAEETGLIVGIGEWVLESACKAAAAWNQGRTTPLRIAVNLSTRQFILNDIVGTVKRVLKATGCRADWLKLEITESLLLGNSKEISAALATFDEMGLVISIDDFGTGYSALSYLNTFPVSQIKIDRSFVMGIPDDRDKAELVKAMISIAKSLRLDLVAEGVETTEQASYLRVHGCLTAQGYLFGKPMPQVEFERLIAGARG